MTASDAQYRLDTATPEDVPALLECAGRSFVDDRHTQLKAIAHGYGWRAEDVIRYQSEGVRGLYEALQDPKRNMIVARDKSSSVLGSVVWTKKLVGEDQTQKRQIGAHIPPLDEAEYATPKNIANLEKTTNAAMSHFISHLMPSGHTCWYIVSINVHPAHQGKGIGTALINWGAEKADVEGLPCWVSSSHGAVRMFEGCGFQEVGRLELCLDEWAEGIVRPSGLAGNDKEADPPKEWGQYVWTWLERAPAARAI